MSFFDSNDDGVGDIPGIIAKLDYLHGLGIDAIWLSPVYKSPMLDFGYDVSDYRQIDPVFGTLEDLKLLLEKAHLLGIRVIMDMVINHTSDNHRWFLESRSSKDNPKHDWYIWRDGRYGGPPNNWKSFYGGSSWEYDGGTNQFYLHTFLKQQPDLNWRNKELRSAVFKELVFWLDLGVDGFRLDAMNMVGKQKRLKSIPDLFGFLFFFRQYRKYNQPASYKFGRKLRNLLNNYDDKMSVGEIFTLPPGDPSRVASYLEDGDNSIHLAFDFSIIFRSWNARKYYRCIERWYSKIPEKGWPCNVLSNHDLLRSIDRFRLRRNKEAKAKVAATFLLTLKGTPFIYYGEEIGMRNANIKRGDIRDPLGKRFWPFFKGRDRARTPMQWSDGPEAGFTRGKPWLPVNHNHKIINVIKQKEDSTSLYHHYETLIRIRKEHKALHLGEWMPLVKGDHNIIAYYRIFMDEKILVALNFSNKPRMIHLENDGKGTLLYSTHRVIRKIFKNNKIILLPFESFIMKMA